MQTLPRPRFETKRMPAVLLSHLLQDERPTTRMRAVAALTAKESLFELSDPTDMSDVQK